MGSRMYVLPLLGIFIMLLIDQGNRVQTSKWYRYCNVCERFDGFQCVSGMKSCWKYNVLKKNRTCTTDNYYYYDMTSGRYLFRYTKLSCRQCDEGMFRAFHDLMRETYCCSHKNRCNTGNKNLDTTFVVGNDIPE